MANESEQLQRLVDSHSLVREIDIQKVCASVINVTPVFSYNPNGADDSHCPFCYERVYFECDDMAKIQHSSDCPYFIAKGLSTITIKKNQHETHSI